jgi:heat shock protein HslJ
VTNVVFERDGTDLWKGAPASGQTQDCPPKAGKVVYALGAYGPGGQDLEKVTVTVNQPASPPTSTPVPPVNPLVGPTWELITLDNASVDTALGVNLIFQSNGSVQGFDGCANFSATYQSSGGQLSFSDLPSGTGVSNCLPDAQTVSTAYLTALSEITNFSISGNTLTLKDADGAQRLQYNKEPPPGTQNQRHEPGQLARLIAFNCFCLTSPGPWLPPRARSSDQPKAQPDFARSALPSIRQTRSAA